MSNTHSIDTYSRDAARAQRVDPGMDEISATADWALATKDQHRGTVFRLNRPFVEATDPAVVKAFLSALKEVGLACHQHGRKYVRAALGKRLDAIGLRLYPAEFDKFVDEISRAEWVGARTSEKVQPE